MKLFSLAKRPEERPYVSYTRMKTWLDCPQRYFYQYVEQCEQERIGGTLIFGGAMHDFLDFVYTLIMRGGPMPCEEEAKSIAVDAFSRRLSGEVVEVEWPKGATAGSMKDEMATLAGVFVSELEPPEDVVCVESEGWSDIVTDDGEVLDAYFLYRPDAVTIRNGVKVLEEHKTGSKRYSASRIDYDLQVSLYLEAEELERFQFNLLVRQKTKPGLEVYKASRNAAERAEAVGVLVAMLRGVEAGVYYPKRDWHCSGCPFRDRCRSALVF